MDYGSIKKEIEINRKCWLVFFANIEREKFNIEFYNKLKIKL